MNFYKTSMSGLKSYLMVVESSKSKSMARKVIHDYKKRLSIFKLHSQYFFFFFRYIVLLSLSRMHSYLLLSSINFLNTYSKLYIVPIYSVIYIQIVSL